LTKIDENILTVSGLLKMPPMGDVERRMTAVRLRDGGLVVYSAIALSEAEMSALEAFGTPSYLIVPNDIHRMDAKVWKDRYPAMQVITPVGARERVQEVVPVDATDVSFGDPNVQYVTVPGTGDREAALVIQTESGTTLVLNDLIFNLANRPGFSGWLFKAIGMTGDEPHLPPVIKLRQVKDEAALRAQLERWAELPNLRRVVVSHGNIITNDAGPLLRRIAGELAA
jgi:hypothetical protein